ncbi:trigger factor [Falsiroseomonas selenitidurans]|uniref:Trigger factor n=1 Tax=Falsiroseomonas selenitidurans TaxID=2716335 RepID=A0ABX1E2S0_9PROT|nr:trigger factor [Falsiroseomonas selenitidurans]NKC31338.1 trigger factor [Falsiroseomonas selenitidurans]
MQVTELPAEGLKRAFQVVVPAASLAEKRDKRLKELGADLRLPGFRPGKVPTAVVKQRYGQAVAGEVLEQSVDDATRQVIADRGLRPATQPKIELVNYSEGADLEYKIDLELLPEIAMPDFAAIVLERQKATPGEAEIDAFLATMAGRLANLEDVAEPRPAAKGEMLVVDFEGRTRNEDGSLSEPFPGGTATDTPIEVAGEGFIPGFTEQLEGMAPGEQKDIQVSFPAEYGSAELAGKDAVFAISAKALKVKVLPVMDDEFAKRVGLDDIATLRGKVAENLQGEYDALARMKVKRALLDALAEKAVFEVPPGMVAAEFEQIWQRVEQDLKAGRLDEDDKGKDEETLKADYRAIAERRIRLGLLLSEIGRSNNIQVTNDELGQAMRQEASRYQGQEKQVLEYFRKNPQAVESLRAPIFEEKVVDYVLELAQVTETPIAPAELTAQAAG